MIRARIVATGSELIADRQDTNGPDLARRLEARGVRIDARLVAPDDLDALASCVRESLASCDLVLVVGGLGPTDDDVTRAAVTRVTGVEMERDAAAVARIEGFVRRRGSGTVSEVTLRQALVPVGAEVVRNVVGLAPGAVMGLGAGPGDAVLVLLPGPPQEMTAMADAAIDSALGRLAAAGRSPELPLRSHGFRLASLSESEAARRMEALEQLRRAEGREPIVVSYLVHPGDLNVTLRCRDEARLAEAVPAARAAFGRHVYSEDGRTLAEVVVATLAQRFETVTCAESCTGGLLAGEITSVPGSSAAFRSSFVTYANEAKTALVGVPRDVLAKHGAVSEEVVRAMASGARRAAQSDWALSVSGIAGPDGGTADKPVGLVWIGLAWPDGRVDATRHYLPGTRDDVRRRSVAAALDALGRALA